jgi:hypothetical protein
VQVNVDVRRAADEVFAFISDVENNPRWQQGMRTCRWTSPAPHEVGSTYEQVAHFLGKDVVSKFVISDHDPGRRVTFTTTKSPFPITETRVVQPQDGVTRVTAHVGGDAGGFFKVAGPLLRLLVARSVRADYGRLRRLLDTG